MLGNKTTNINHLRTGVYEGKYLEKEICNADESVLMIHEGGDVGSQHKRVMMVAVVGMEKKEFEG